MDADKLEINLGEVACKKIKDIYFSTQSWQECHQAVAKKFTDLKHIMGNFNKDLDRLDVIREINQFDTLAFDDAFSLEADYGKGKDKEVNPKYGDKVTWVPVPIEKIELLAEIRKMLV